VTKIRSLTIMNLVTPKAGPKCEFLFNEQVSGLLNKSLSLADALGVTQF
jgi:hypothetical protein